MRADVAELAGARSSSNRWASLGGVIFGLMFIVATFVGSGTPDYSAPDEYVTFYSDSGNRMQAIIQGYLMVVSALALLWFVVDLFSRIRTRLHEPSRWSTAILASGALAVAMLLIAATLFMSVPASVSFGGALVPSGELAIQIEQLGYGIMLLPGMLCAAIFLATTSLAGRRVGLLPGWLVWLGIVAAVLLLLGPLFIPALLLPLWALVTGIVLLRQPAASLGAAPEPAPAD